jgi:hypothetical protein
MKSALLSDPPANRGPQKDTDDKIKTDLERDWQNVSADFSTAVRKFKELKHDTKKQKV